MEGVYRRGMQEEVMLEAGVVHAVFPCLDQLLEWHCSFLSELLRRRREGLVEGSATNFTVGQIGDLLLRQVGSRGQRGQRGVGRSVGSVGGQGGAALGWWTFSRIPGSDV